jgi:hypothetical protein
VRTLVLDEAPEQRLESMVATSQRSVATSGREYEGFWCSA